MIHCPMVGSPSTNGGQPANWLSAASPSGIYLYEFVSLQYLTLNFASSETEIYQFLKVGRHWKN